MAKLILKNILAYSINNKRFFSSEFGNQVNIIHGRNTSGKSTLMQSILYSMGVNDSKENLIDIIDENVVFRLECEIQKNNVLEKIVFVRLDDTLVIRIADKSPIRFDGINGNTSFEYGRYKELFNQIFDFKLKLQKQTDFTSAPIEAAFLPFYISQSVGWVYLRESIGDYRFYKDFKFDYLDYYTGLTNRGDRLKKYTLQKEKQQLEYELNQLTQYKLKDKPLNLSEKIEARFQGKVLDYLKKYNSITTEFILQESNYEKLCNKLSLLRSREKVLLQTIRNLKLQKPRVDRCPVCEQTLPGDIRELYLYNQDFNDTLKQKDNVSDEIKKVSASLNSVEKKLKNSSEIINVEYELLKESRAENIEFDNWLDHHSNIKMLNEIKAKESNYDKRILELQINIDSLGNDTEIDKLRNDVEKEFFQIFNEKAKYLEVKIPNNSRYKNLYSITSFPYQGVELHKIIMAYHFSFHKLIGTKYKIHKLPFLLDAVFKEDIDAGNRELIFDFLGNEAKNKEQMLFTVAEYKKEGNQTNADPLFNINEINKKYFSGNAKLICIGDAKSIKSFLQKKELNINEQFLLEDTFSLLETV